MTTTTSGAADRAIENCPELNMSNYDEVGVERLNDWAIRANDEIDRLHALAVGQATAAPAGGVVAYLDIGAGGYLDLGSDLSNEEISRLPKGRHALIVAGTYCIDGYTPTTPAQADSVLEDAARWHWMAEYIVGTRTDLDDELIASATVYELRKLVDADLAARKQGEKQ